MKTLSASVRDLADLCRGGDINFRFSTRSSAMEGIRGHQRVQKSRGTNYISEYPVSITVSGGEIKLRLSGRIDGIGYDRQRSLFVIEEIKTLRVAVSEIPAAIMDGYWHQVLLYAHMLLQEVDHDAIIVRLCFFHLEEESEEVLERLISRAELTHQFADTLLYYLGYLDRREMWFAERRVSIAAMGFPYSEFRSGQRDLSVAVFRALSDRQHLVVEAPTGLGKTMGTIFPAIRQLEHNDVKRVMYLSARTSTQQQALIAVRDVTSAGTRIRSVVLTAKDKICFSPGEPCHPDHCRFAQGYYDKLPGVLGEVLVTDREFSRERVEQLAADHQMCPFELGLDLAGECDFIIADYNYVFDPVVYLRRFFDRGEKDTVVLVDEAHNLVDRGRSMFSAALLKEQFLDVARLMSDSSPSIARAGRAVNRSILDYRRLHKAQLDDQSYIVDAEPPEEIIAVLRRFVEAAEEELRQEHSDLAGSREILLETYFDALRFLRTEEWFDNSYTFLLTRARNKHRLQLYCVDPSVRLAEVFDRLAGSVSFSATLRPSGFFRQMLGVPEQANWYRLPSPFPKENLHVALAPFIDTSYQGRKQSIDALCSLIHEVIHTRKGNYLVFFPSYQYLENVRDRFVENYPSQVLQVQERTMSDGDREAFLYGFNQTTQTCGFAVMGGAFSEGIDLKGNRLIGVIVVGVGLPQVGIERDLIRDHFPDHGFEYAYQYPGLTRVLQTAGRLIRDESDEGVLCFVDRRYAEPRYLELLPEHWDARISRTHQDMIQGISDFWSR